MGFAGTMLLPVDVEQTIERDPLDAFEDMWMFVYWGTFICSWVVLPVLMVGLVCPRDESWCHTLTPCPILRSSKHQAPSRLNSGLSSR